MRGPSFIHAVRGAILPRDATARTMWAIAAALVVGRSFVFAAAQQAFFDSDQAVFGLMAKHISEGRAFPVFMYGQNYILAVEAWMAAPLFLVGGASVALLKLPLIAINVVTALLLVGLLTNEAGLSAQNALVSSLFFIVPPPGTAAQLVEASGGNLEPFLYILLLWIARRDGVAFGAILAVGFLHREFTVYAVVALIVVELADRRLLTRESLHSKTRAVLAFAAVWVLVWTLKFYASAAGPGTSIRDVAAPASNIGELLARFCGDVGAMLRHGSDIYREYLAYLLGLHVQPVADFAVNSTVVQGMRGLPVIVGLIVTLCVGVLIGRRSTIRDDNHSGHSTADSATAGAHPASRVRLYLGTVGIAAIVFYAWGRCGELSIFTLRYGLLALFLVIALTASALDPQTPRSLRRRIAALVLVWAAVSGVAHTRIVLEYIRRPPPNWRGIIADYLVERGVRFAESDYWTAYHVTFLARERVIVGANDLVRIATYQRILDEHRSEVWKITKERCATGLQVIPNWYICPP